MFPPQFFSLVRQIMCKLKPGPRCANHTKRNLVRLRRKVRDLTKELTVASTTHTSLSLRSNVASSELLKARSQFEGALNDLAKAEAELAQAQLMFDSTPTGQKALADRVNLTDDEALRTDLVARLDHARAERARQEEMYTLLRTGSARVEKNEDKELAEFREELENWNTSQAQGNKEIEKMKQNYFQTKNDLETQNNIYRTELVKLQQEQAQLHATLKRAYQEAGIHPNLATIYANDTLANTQVGWDYPTENSADRHPIYTNQFEFKTKGVDHQDHEKTLLAQSIFNSEYADTLERYHNQIEKYHNTIPPLKEAKQKYALATNLAQKKIETFQETSKEAYNIKEKYNHKASLISAQLNNTQTWQVDATQFRASLYRNPDGTTNGYVRYHHDGWEPTYLQAREIISTGNERKVIFEGGHELTAEELKTASFVLTRPGQDAVKQVFN